MFQSSALKCHMKKTALQSVLVPNELAATALHRVVTSCTTEFLIVKFFISFTMLYICYHLLSNVNLLRQVKCNSELLCKRRFIPRNKFNP